MLLYASHLLNPGRAPVAEAALWIQGDRIRYAGPRAGLPEEAKKERQSLDLGEAVVAPGLVDAHAHLELTALKGLPYPGDFVGWIRAVLGAKQALEPQRQDQEMHEGVLRLLRGGTTCVGDHLSVASNPEALLRSPLRGKAFVEVLGVVPEVAADMAQAAELFAEQWGRVPSRLEIVPSPHSVHALAPEVLKRLLEDPSRVHSVHLAESEAERRYFADKCGELHDFIAERGSPLRREAESSIAELEAAGVLDARILAVHGNYLSDAEIRLLASRGISLVHCPFSHQYFGHRPFPMAACRAAGLNLALGTDSLASAKTLSMFEVLRKTRANFPELSRDEIFVMATLGGAKALGLEAEIGSLEVGKKADLIAVSAAETPLDSVFAAKRVDFAMIDGEILTGF